MISPSPDLYFPQAARTEKVDKSRQAIQSTIGNTYATAKSNCSKSFERKIVYLTSLLALISYNRQLYLQKYSRFKKLILRTGFHLLGRPLGL